MKRIAVIGSPGSGKSWLSERLAEAARLPLFHLDDHFWNADWKPADPDQWTGIVTGLAAEPEWIIDGHHSKTMPIVLARAEGVVLLDLSPLLCTFRVLRRFVQIWLGDRSSLPARIRDQPKPAVGNRIRAFLWFVLTFRKKKLPEAMAVLSELEGKRIVVLRRRDVREFVARLSGGGISHAFAGETFDEHHG